MKNIFHPRIEYLLQCAKYSGFTEASRQMGITQAALSTAIKHLEGDLGIKVFERHAKGFSLTPAGQAFLEKIRGLYRQTQETLQPITAGLTKPLIRIGTNSHFARRHLFPILMRDKEQFLQTQFFLGRSLYILKSVEEGALDFGFVGWTTKPAYHRYIRLYKDPIAIVGHCKKFAHITHAKSLKDLEKEPWVLMPKPQHDWTQTLHVNQRGFVVSEVFDLKFLLLNGYGIGEAQLHLFTQEELKKLVQAPVTPLHPDVYIYAIYSPTLSGRAKTRFDFIVQETQAMLKNKDAV